MMETVKDMIERRKDDKQVLDAEIRVLQRVNDFVVGVKDVIPDIEIDVDCPRDGAITIRMFVGSDVERVENSGATFLSDMQRLKDTCPPFQRMCDAVQTVDALASISSLQNFEHLEFRDTNFIHPKASDPDKTLPPPPNDYKTGDWTDEEIELAKNMDADGKSIAEISSALNRRGPGVSAKLRAFARAASDPVAGAAEPDAEGPVSEVRDEVGGISSSLPDHPVAHTPKIKATNGVARDMPKDVWETHVGLIAVECADHPFWTIERYLILAEALLRGDGIPGAIAALSKFDGCPPREAMIQAWKTLCPQVTIENQKRLIAALKARVAA
jgi:hypothetical protein